jgi:hypothetical protein
LAANADLHCAETKRMTTMTAESDDDNRLLVGAKALAEAVFQGQLHERQVYRLLETDRNWPAFKLLGRWSGRLGPMRAELARREVRQTELEESAKPKVQPRLTIRRTRPVGALPTITIRRQR